MAGWFISALAEPSYLHGARVILIIIIIRKLAQSWKFIGTNSAVFFFFFFFKPKHLGGE